MGQGESSSERNPLFGVSIMEGFYRDVQAKKLLVAVVCLLGVVRMRGHAYLHVVRIIVSVYSKPLPPALSVTLEFCAQSYK